MWFHENTWVYGDRLIEDEDRNWLKSLLEKEILNTLNIKNEDLYNAEWIIFGDFMLGLEVEPRIYQQVSDLKLFLSKIIEYLEEYNNVQKNKMRLVMFLDACDHVARIAWCVWNPLGNAFLLGVGGSGW